MFLQRHSWIQPSIILFYPLPPSAFLFIFQVMVLCFWLRLALDRNLPTYSLSHSWNHRSANTWLIDRDGGLTIFLPRLTLNCNPSHLCLPSSWDYRWEPPAWFYFLTYLCIYYSNIHFILGKVCSWVYTPLDIFKGCILDKKKKVKIKTYFENSLHFKTLGDPFTCFVNYMSGEGFLPGWIKNSYKT
jgi:hypothetical protein